jgi:hypothetical protein
VGFRALTFVDLGLCCATSHVPYLCHDHDHDHGHGHGHGHNLPYACCGFASASVFSELDFAHADVPDCGFGFDYGFDTTRAVFHRDFGSAPLLPHPTLPEHLVAGGLDAGQEQAYHPLVVALDTRV